MTEYLDVDEGDGASRNVTCRGKKRGCLLMFPAYAHVVAVAVAVAVDVAVVVVEAVVLAVVVVVVVVLVQSVSPHT